jgi:energy-coupling factor transporter transmembrane protein EcfT
MNQSKFSLADVLTLLTALAFGFVCYLGANFYTLGNISQSIILAVVITVLLCGTMLGAKLLKRTGRNFKTCFVWEIILLVLSGLTTFFACSPFLHYFSVSGQKMEIRSKLTASITQAENMFTEYERYAKNRENLYESKLRSVAAAKNTRPKEFDEYGFINNISVDKQIENKMFTIHAHLFPSNYEEMEQTGSAWLVNARNIVNSWNWTGIVGVVNEVEKNSNNWLNTLVELSTIPEKGEQAEDFAYDLSFDDVKNHFTTLGKPTLLSIGLAIVVYLLMLLSYLISERSTKTTIGTTNSKGGEFYIDY